jgi:hypothetical protein
VEEFAELAESPVCREVARGGVFICLELQCGKISCTDTGGEQD